MIVINKFGHAMSLRYARAVRSINKLARINFDRISLLDKIDNMLLWSNDVFSCFEQAVDKKFKNDNN